MAEITKSDGRDVPKFVWLALAALGLVTYFAGLNMPFVGPDEARYAQVAREMWQAEDWITPTLGGFHWFEKPALLYWLQIASYHIFGVSEFSARLGPALCGIGTVVSLWWLGRNGGIVENRQRALGFGRLLALMAASTISIVVFAHGASFDIVVTVTITAALASFFVANDRAESGRARVTLPLVLFYVFVGLSLLAKGLIGVFLPGAIIGFYYVIRRRWPGRMVLFSLTWGGVIALAVAATWYLPMYLKHGWEFVDEFFIQHHFARYTSNKYQHPQPFYFFLWVLPLMLLPWTPFFFAGIWRRVRAIFQNRDTETQGKDGDRDHSRSSLFLFSLSWTLVPLVFFSFSGSKLPGYVLPAVPGTILLTALFVHDLAQRSSTWLRAALSVATAVFLALTLAALFVAPRFAQGESVKSLIEAADARGFASLKVLMVHKAPSHNAEFYAAGRLVRDTDGNQKRIWTNIELIDEIRRLGTTEALAMTTVDQAGTLLRDPRLSAETLKDNGELAILHVAMR